MTMNYKTKTITDPSEYTLQLANGRTKSFASASELAEWMSQQSAVRRTATLRNQKSKTLRTRRRPARQNAKATSCNRTKPSAPLARYANRKSSEA